VPASSEVAVLVLLLEFLTKTLTSDCLSFLECQVLLFDILLQFYFSLTRWQIMIFAAFFRAITNFDRNS